MFLTILKFLRTKIILSFKKRSLDQNYITFRFNWWGGNTDKRLTKLSNQSLGRTPAVVVTKIIRATLNNFTNYKSAQLHRSYVRNRGWMVGLGHKRHHIWKSKCKYLLESGLIKCTLSLKQKHKAFNIGES